jgi:ABC-type multidrug transport system ATPase subunit
MIYCRRNGITGSVLVNGMERDIDQFRRQSSYIMQDDKLQPLLTVHEAMTIAANLKLGPEFSPKHKQERVSSLSFTHQHLLVCIKQYPH